MMNVFLLLPALALAAEPQTSKFTGMSARTLPKGAWSKGVFEPLRYGVSDDLTLSVRPLEMVLMPNVAVKRQWGDLISGVLLSTEHNVTVPTPLLRQLARPGIGGVLPPDSTIPWGFISGHTVFLSSDVDEESLTGWAKMEFGLGFGDSDVPTIDIPLAYRKTAVAQNGLALLAGLRSSEILHSGLGYVAQVQAWSLPMNDMDWGLEVQLEGLWQPTSGFQLHTGALLSYGEFPYGDNFHILPTFDMVWAWGGKG